MSSGNPFRASLAYQPASSSPVPQTSFITADSSVPEDGHSGAEGTGALPLKTKKHVRIGSNTTFIPPHPGIDGGADSPRSKYVSRFPPAPSAYPSHTNVYAGQPIAQTRSGRQDIAIPDVWTGASSGYQASQSAPHPSGVPANPFSRTLASIEPHEQDRGEERTAPERPALGNPRASLDVESFKNLLMTGRAGPRPAHTSHQKGASPSAVPAASQFESSSSTDTSSVSRQSLFEASQHTHVDSPRTSLDMADSDKDEDLGLVSDVNKGKRKPPPAPKHRHGKLVTQRQPQTVAFEDFSASEPAQPLVTKNRGNSDAGKPLPPAPIASPQAPHNSTQGGTQQRPLPVQQHSSELSLHQEALETQKRTPPPVPLARRQSQLRQSATSNRTRSDSSLTMTSEHSVEASLPDAGISNTDVLSVAKSPPPPPRPRHGTRLTDLHNNHGAHSSTEQAQRSASGQSIDSGYKGSSSRRSTMESESASASISVGRTLSLSSNRNTPRVVSSESTSSLHMASPAPAPPPPPPPRRRQSNRSSLDQQRPNVSSSTSANESRGRSSEHGRTSLDNNRRTSVASESSLRRAYAPAETKAGTSSSSEYALYAPNEETETETRLDLDDSSTILDDMDKFQREIEELRQRYTKAK
ncbi:hypothetical protein ACEQ8H_005288 [Pleosporales sp. CAS-2024a]